jgi:endonuclease/exonuclease/phosphatase family metal-dependent hydrolase
MVNRLIGMLLLLSLGMASSACRTVENYDDPKGPLFEGKFSQDDPLFDGTLKVVTWNIAFGEEVEGAIDELSQSDELSAADILLLQEMDEAGVEAIAQALGLNYIYYPATVHSKHDKNFGNAILSKWPLSDPKKLILPHRNPKNDQIRIAAHALANIRGELVPVYSVHTETFWLGGEERADQIDTLIEDLPADYEYMIVGGDFNTLTPASVDELENRFKIAELDRSTAEAGPSIGLSGVGLTLDQIFTKGFRIIQSGSFSGSDSSDHNPLWVELNFNN